MGHLSLFEELETAARLNWAAQAGEGARPSRIFLVYFRELRPG
jgi:hypothetical protein